MFQRSFLSLLVASIVAMSASSSAQTKLAQRQNQAPIKSRAAVALDDERPDMNSVKSLQAYMAKLNARIKIAKAGGPSKAAIMKGLQKKYDWYGAHLFLTKQRAWPNDTVDWSELDRAIAERKNRKSKRPELIASKIPPQNLEHGDYPDSNWAFIGPNDLDSPGGGGGPSPICGRVAGIAISSQNPDLVWYVAGGNGGVFKTTDAGTTWDSLSDNWDHLYVGDIIVDPTNENIVYVGLGDYDDYQRYGQGIMKSTNGGTTWTLLQPVANFSAPIADLEIDPDNHNHIFAAAGRGFDSGLWESTDAGANWTQVWAGDWQTISYSTRVGSTRFFYASGAFNLIRASNQNWNWSSIDPLFSTHTTSAVACSKVSQGTVYFMATGEQQVLKSTDFGANWSLVSGSGSGFTHGNANGPTSMWKQNNYDWYLQTTRTSANADVLICGLLDMQTSRNGGGSWADTGGHYAGSATIHVDHHVCVNHPTNPDVVFIGTDGGFYRMAWSSVSNNWLISNPWNKLPISMFFSFAAHPTDSQVFMGGTQDNGTPHSFGNYLHWGTVGGADGTGTAIYQPNPNYQFRLIQNAGYSTTSPTLKCEFTTDAWATSSTANSANALGEDPAFAAPITATTTGVNPSVYIGSNYLYRLTINGTIPFWTNRVGNFNFGSSITAIAVAPSNNAVLYVGTSDGEVYRSGNSGTSWTAIYTGGRSVTCINPSPADANNVLMTVTGSVTLEGNVLRCTNTTAATPVWDDRGLFQEPNTLPRIWTNWIERDPWQPTTTWYVGNELGVWYTDDQGVNWYDMTYGFGMPQVAVRRLVAVPGSNRLFAATYGRGAYRMLIANTRPVVNSVSWLSTTIIGGSIGILQVTFDQVTPPDGLQINMSYTPTTPFNNPPLTRIVPGGRTSYLLAVPTNVVSTDTLVGASVAGQYGGNLGALANVLAHQLTTLTLSSATVVGSYNVTGNVFLNYDAPQGGITVALSSSNTSAATVPSSVTVPYGTQVASFTVASKSVTTTTNLNILATYNGTTLSKPLSVTPINLTGHAITQTSITGGDQFSGTVTIASAAGPQGVTINLSSNNANAQVPATVTVPSGSTTGNYSGTSSLVSPSTVTATITANKGTSFYTDTVSLQPISVSSVSFTPNPAFAGRPVTMKITTSRATPIIGMDLAITCSDPKAVNVPATVHMNWGSTAVNVPITVNALAVGHDPLKVKITVTHMSSKRTGTLSVPGR